MKKIDKVKIFVFIIIYLFMITAILIAFFEKNWMYLGISLLTLIVMLLPVIIERRLSIDIPGGFEIILILFVYSGVYLGELQHFYNKFWWWDKMLHSFSGLILGNIGFLIINYLTNNSKINIKRSPIFVALFSFCFAVAMGAIWEIYEYSMDKTLGLFMQRGSLDDTMIDIILDTIGALVFSILGYFNQKNKIRRMYKE